jgi:hypothetical protein
MGEEVHLKGVRRASPLPLWRLARRVIQKQCSHLQLNLFHHVEWLEWIYKETLTELTEPAANGEYFSSFPRSLPSLPPPSSYISLYSHLHLRSNALL